MIDKKFTEYVISITISTERLFKYGFTCFHICAQIFRQRIPRASLMKLKDIKSIDILTFLPEMFKCSHSTNYEC